MFPKHYGGTFVASVYNFRVTSSRRLQIVKRIPRMPCFIKNTNVEPLRLKCLFVLKKQKGIVMLEEDLSDTCGFVVFV